MRELRKERRGKERKENRGRKGEVEDDVFVWESPEKERKGKERIRKKRGRKREGNEGGNEKARKGKKER